MLRRKLVHTAVTRSKKLVMIVGQPKALALAVKGAQARRRWSKLKDWLGGDHKPVDGRQGRHSDELYEPGH